MSKFNTVSEYREHNRELVEQIKQAAQDKQYARRDFLSYKYRFYHIAYCMLRGTPYERIEAKVREGNEPNWSLINELIQKNEGLKHVPRERKVSVADTA